VRNEGAAAVMRLMGVRVNMVAEGFRLTVLSSLLAFPAALTRDCRDSGRDGFCWSCGLGLGVG